MIKVHDIAYVRFASPDLDAAERFVRDFGLQVNARQGDVLYARGTDPAPYAHVTELGDPAFLGMGFEAASAADLQAAAKLPGASGIEKIDAPGGGECVRFTDPDGFAVEVVHGREQLAPLPVTGASPLNRGSERVRLGTLQRVPGGPPPVKRLGHAVVRVSDFRASEEWYKSRFGFLSSDEVYIGEPDNVVTAFMRCDRGGRLLRPSHTAVCRTRRGGLRPRGLRGRGLRRRDDRPRPSEPGRLRAPRRHRAPRPRKPGLRLLEGSVGPGPRALHRWRPAEPLPPDGAGTTPATALGTQWGKFG